MPKPPAAKGLNMKTAGVKHKWWLVGGAAAAVGIVYYTRKQRAATTTTDPNAATDTSQATDPYAGYDTGYGTGAGGTYGGAYNPPTTDTSTADMLQYAADSTAAEQTSASALSGIAAALAHPETNQGWMHRAIQALEAHGYTHSQARHAIVDYLAGAAVTTKQAHTIETAVGKIGPPPVAPPHIVIENPHNHQSGNGKKGDRGGDKHKTNDAHKKTATKPPRKSILPRTGL